MCIVCSSKMRSALVVSTARTGNATRHTHVGSSQAGDVAGGAGGGGGPGGGGGGGGALFTDPGLITDGALAGLAKSFRGGFNNTHGVVLAGHAIKHAVAKAGVDPAMVEDVVMGCGKAL